MRRGEKEQVEFVWTPDFFHKEKENHKDHKEHKEKLRSNFEFMSRKVQNVFGIIEPSLS